jgi:uncharacterized protein YjeT (DUF2065 family)
MTSRIWLAMCVVLLVAGLVVNVDTSTAALICVATSTILRKLGA